jgi:hypothetical protein
MEQLLVIINPKCGEKLLGLVTKDEQSNRSQAKPPLR